MSTKCMDRRHWANYWNTSTDLLPALSSPTTLVVFPSHQKKGMHFIYKNALSVKLLSYYMPLALDRSEIVASLQDRMEEPAQEDQEAKEAVSDKKSIDSVLGLL